MEPANNIVFSKSVIEFVTVAKEFCLLIENIKILSEKDFVSKSQKILALLYLKAALLPEIIPVENEPNEKFVKEFEFNYVRTKVEQKLDSHDVNLEVITDLGNIKESSITASISELFAEIYEEIFNFISIFRSGDQNKMNDSLWECKQNFEQLWGNKLLSLLTALHIIIYKNEE